MPGSVRALAVVNSTRKPVDPADKLLTTKSMVLIPGRKVAFMLASVKVAQPLKAKLPGTFTTVPLTLTGPPQLSDAHRPTMITVLVSRPVRSTVVR